MSNDFFDALELISKEKGIPPAYLADKIANAILIAVKKDYPGTENVNVTFDLESRKYNVSIVKRVVEEVQDEENEITLEEARTFSKRARVGSDLEIKLKTEQFGRIAAQTAKHVIRQGIRDIEREILMEKMGGKVGEVVSVVVQSVDPTNGNAVVRLEENETLLFQNDQLPDDHLHAGDRIKVYVVDVVLNEKRRALKISRTHKDLVKRLFEMQVPEIADGLVEIKAVAREAGFRSKIAVCTNDENIDPVGACIGAKGMRVNSIIEELGGEKIDVIQYDENPEHFIAAALAPAKVVKIDLYDEKEKIAFVSVPDGQLSLAIGNKGQNAKLSARLTGYKIDISPESGFYGEDKQARIEARLENLHRQSDETAKEERQEVDETLEQAPENEPAYNSVKKEV